jgi:hypothetical protein
MISRRTSLASDVQPFAENESITNVGLRAASSYQGSNPAWMLRGLVAAGMLPIEALGKEGLPAWAAGSGEQQARLRRHLEMIESVCSSTHCSLGSRHLLSCDNLTLLVLIRVDRHKQHSTQYMTNNVLDAHTCNVGRTDVTCWKLCR